MHLECESYSMDMISIYCDVRNICQRWSVGVFLSIDRSCHISTSRISNHLDLNYPKDALHISKDGQQTYFRSIEAQRRDRMVSDNKRRVEKQV